MDESGPGRAPDADEPVRDHPSAARDAFEGVLLFAADGALVAGSPGADALDPPIRTLADLADRYRQSDGMPVELSGRGRSVGVPIDGRGPRVLLVAEPLTPANGAPAAATLSVAMVPFREVDDPLTLQRALGSVLAHELRTPMTTVYGGAELLAGEGLSDPLRREAADSVARAAEQLHRVVEDLVLLVRWSVDPPPDPEPILLEPILRRVIGRRSRQQVPIDLQVERGLPPVVGSESSLEHVVRNLVDHAITNSPPGGRVQVTVTGRDGWVRLTVADEGAPRDEDERERAFDLFAPISQQRVDPSGANLSLVVARRLVERVDGRIRAGGGPGGAETIVELRPAIESTGDGRPL